MSLLQNIVTKVITNAITDNSQQGGLGGLLGGLTGQPQQTHRPNQGGLGGALGGLLGGQNSANAGLNAGLGGMLGGLLGGQSQSRSAGDLGSILGSVLGSQTQAQRAGGAGFNKNILLLALVPIVLGFIQKNGGLSGILAKFNDNGLGNKAQSWVNIDRDNDGIDAGDVMQLFGQDEIDNISRETGASQNDVAQGIAELLPEVMNDLTPHGDVGADEKEANDEISQILAQFKKAF